MARKIRQSARTAAREEIPPPRIGKEYVVRVAPPGASYGDIPAEVGRVFSFDSRTNLQRAGQLLRMEYILPFEGDHFRCRVCGAPFASDQQRQAHGHRTHDPKEDPIARALAGRAQELRAVSRRRSLTFDEQAELDHLETEAAKVLEAKERAEERRVASPRMDRTEAARA